MEVSMKYFTVLFLVVIIGGLYPAAVWSSSSDKYTYTSNSRIESNTGIPRVLYFVNAGPYQGTPEEIARQFLSERIKTLRLKKNLDDLKTVNIQETPMGNHITFQQTYEGLPLYRSDIVVTVDRSNKVVFTVNNYKSGIKVSRTTPKITSENAIQTARRHLKVKGKLIGDQSATLMIHAEDRTPRLAYRVIIPTENPRGDWEVFVDAINGTIFSVRDMAVYSTPSTRRTQNQGVIVNGSGYVYDPDPMTTAGVARGTAGYADSNDADSPQLDAQRVLVTLRDITLDSLAYKLKGPYVQLKDFETPADAFTNPAHPDSFRFKRSQQAFEEVMVYYHIDKIQRYIQSLGFNGIQNLSIPVDPHGLNGADNSYYLPSTNSIAFGEGGVDDAEDADVIWHEYGHAIHFGTKPTWGGGEADHIGEGFGDYWAGSYSKSGWAFGSDSVFNWDGTAAGASRRALTDPRHYPRNGVAAMGVHDAGKIWSAVLMLLWSDLGREIMDKLVLQSHFLLGNNPTMSDNACAIIQADRSLYGGTHVNTLVQRFISRGFLRVDIEFVIDDTGSMGEEIGGVRNALTAFLSRFSEDTCIVYQLTTYKDDVTQRALTIDLTTIRNQVASLVADGGGDCPEASVQALNSVKDTVRKGGTILFATDASPHAGQNLNAAISALRARGVRVNVLLSGDCSGGLESMEDGKNVISSNSLGTQFFDKSKSPDRLNQNLYKRVNPLLDTLILGDDDYIEVNLPFAFPFGGRNFNSVFVNANGYITFGDGIREYSPSSYYLTLGPRRIVGYWADLYPPAGGTVVAQQVSSEFHISYTNIRNTSATDTVNFTIRLRSNGTFRVDYGKMPTGLYGLAGFSAGNGVTDPSEIDLSTASQPISATANGTTYELFSSSDNDLSNLSLEYAACTFSPPAGSVSGMKWHDENANGIRDTLEPGLKDWTIIASGPAYRTTKTDSLGKYQFVDLPVGVYYVSESSVYQWTQTYPALGYHSITLDSGSVMTNKDFGNFRSSGIYGLKFYDANNNGVKDTDEPGLSGWQIKITGPETTSTVTASSGYYSFTNLRVGTYIVSEVLDTTPGWSQTYPLGGTWAVNIDTGGSAFYDKNFGNYGAPGTISGKKFHDLNYNNAMDEGEPTLAGWSIYISGAVYQNTVTDSAGNYTFINVPPGAYSVTEGSESGWEQTYPPYSWEVNITPGSAATNKDFGNFKLPTAIESFSRLASETGGFFAYIPGVNTSDSSSIRRYENTALNIVQGGITRSIGLVEPAEGPRGSTLYLNITGSKTNFQSGTSVAISGGGISVTSVSIISPIQLRAEVTLDAGASLGFRDVMTVTDLGGGEKDTAIGTGAFEVVELPVSPTIIGISPPTGAIGDSLIVIVAGASTHFTNSSVLNLGSGITVLNVTALSSTSLRATIKISGTATVGFRNVTITTGGETAYEDVPGPFFVGSAPPAFAFIATISPSSAMQGDSLTLQITGSNTNFVDTLSSVSFSGSGIAVIAVNVISSTLLDVVIKIDQFAALGYRDVFVSTGEENAAALTAFNVVVSPLEVEDEQARIPKTFALHQSYPNPFNPTTVVQFDLPKKAVVSLKIYDVLGREVAALVQQQSLEAGVHKVQFNASSLSSGVYFYRLQADAANETFIDLRKMLFLK